MASAGIKPPRDHAIPTIKPGATDIVTVKPNRGPVKAAPIAPVDPGFDKPLIKGPSRVNTGAPVGSPVVGAGGLTPGAKVVSDPVRVNHFAPVAPVVPAPQSVACYAPDNFNFSVSVGIGVGVGVGIGVNFGNWSCPAPVGFTGCFTSCSPCYPDPFCYRPWYYGPSYWACDPWGGWYARSWSYWPSYWGYPSCHVRSYPCGTWWNIGYGGWCNDWAFRFAYTPCYSYDTCGLVSSSVYSVPNYDYGIPYTAEISPWSYSTNGLYKWAFIPSSVSVPVAETYVAPEPSIAGGDSGLPAPATAEQLRGSSDRQLADVYMRLDDISSAIRVYARHVAKYPGDVDALRSLGVAYLFTDQAAAGIEQIERAYRIDPALATRPFQKSGLEPARLTQAIDAAAQAAATDNSARAWLVVTVLMQADARQAAARTALDKAAAAGLNEQIVSNFRAAMPVVHEQ